MTTDGGKEERRERGEGKEERKQEGMHLVSLNVFGVAPKKPTAGAARRRRRSVLRNPGGVPRMFYTLEREKPLHVLNLKISYSRIRLMVNHSMVK